MTTEGEPTTLDELQSLVAAHDADHWAHPSGLPTVRHNLLHLAITTGRMAAQCEAMEDSKVSPSEPPGSKYVADLAIFAARYANEGNFSLADAVEERLAEIKERLSATTPPNV